MQIKAPVGVRSFSPTPNPLLPDVAYRRCSPHCTVPDPTEVASLLSDQRTTGTRPSRFLGIPSKPPNRWTVIYDPCDSSIDLSILWCCAPHSSPFSCPSPRIADCRIPGVINSISHFSSEKTKRERKNVYFHTEIMIVIEKSKLHMHTSTGIVKAKWKDTSVQWGLDKHLQGVSIVHVLPFTQLAEIWVEGYEGILRSEVQ